MSAVDGRPADGAVCATLAAAGLQLAVCTADVVEIAALRGGVEALRAAARAHGIVLPDFGRFTTVCGQLALSVRPDRWLVLGAPATPGAAAAHWQGVIGTAGAAIDQSSGFELLQLAGVSMREVLARGCRLDLDPGVLAPGSAAATVIAQVPVILATDISHILMLTPSTTAQHLREWLAATALHDGFETQLTLSLDDLLKEIP